MKARKLTVLMVLAAFVVSVFFNFTPAFAAGSSISNINQSISSGAAISENKQTDNAGKAVNPNGAVKSEKKEHKAAKPATVIAAATGEVKLCRARIGRLAVATMNYVKMAKINKKTYPRSAKELVNSNHIAQDEIYCVHTEKGIFGESKQEYIFKLQQPYEKFITISCPVHPENRIQVPMPTDMSAEQLAQEKECKKECMIKMISAAGTVSRAVKVAVHDKKLYPREIGELVKTNHLTKNAVQCPQEIKRFTGVKHEEFMLKLSRDERSYTLECPYHGNLINIKIPKYEDTLTAKEKEELAKEMAREKAREEKLKEDIKKGIVTGLTAPLIPVALTVAGGVWAANTAYEAGKKAGNFLAEKGKQAAEAAAKTAQAAAETAKKVGKAAVDTGKRAAETVVEIGKAAGEAVVNAGETVVATGKKAVEEAGKVLAAAGVAAAESGISILDGAQSFINGGFNMLKNGLNGWKNGLKK